MKKAVLLGFAGALSIGVAFAMAHAGAKGIVKERMDLMSMVAGQTKTLAMMTRGRADINWEVVAKAGDKIAAAGQTFPTLFPEDSFKSPSEALKTILTDSEGFAAESQAMTDAGLALTASAETQDEEALKAAFGQLRGTCKSCHSGYRE